MTPSELDVVISAVQDSACRLCAVLFKPRPNPTRFCQECLWHMARDKRDLKDEPRAERFAMILGLTRDCKTSTVDSVEYTDRVVKGEMTDRMMDTFALLNTARAYHGSRRALIWSRFCALFIPHTADVLAATLGTGRRVASFDCFILVLGNLRDEPAWTRFLLSDDPRAASGNRLAEVVAEQLIFHSSRWEREAESHPQPPATFLVMQHACLVLGHILCVQVDKPAAVHLEEGVRGRVQAILRRWAQTWSGKDTLMAGLRMAYSSLVGDDQYYSYAREHRELWEGLHTCAREGCAKTENLYICSRCQGALYCSRQHQREHWAGESLPHRQVCYRPCF